MVEEPSSGRLRVEGWVTSGVGRGAQFLGLEWVQRELRRKLDLAPFPGTLNLRVSPEVRGDLYARREEFLRIADSSSPHCPGYIKRVILRAKGRFCSAAYLILPELTVYKNVLEFISTDNLRQTLELQDGNRVEVEEFPEP